MPPTTVLPDREELAHRIAEADPDRAAEVLYPGILSSMAGRKLRGSGVVVALTVAIRESLEERDLREGAFSYEVRLLKLMPDFVKAIVDDEQVRAEALEILAESGYR